MKSLVESIYESISKLNSANLDALNVFIDRLQKFGLKKFEDIVFKNDEMNPKFAEILDKYDNYVENVLYEILQGRTNAKEVYKNAEENERKTGTEAIMIINFLGDVCTYLKI